MANLNLALNERIARVARKEIRAQTGTLKRATTRYRSDIAALKLQARDLAKRLQMLENRPAPSVPIPHASTPPQQPAGMPRRDNFSPSSVKSQRARLGLTARELAKLLGVSPMAVQSWESGRRRPRAAKLAAIIALRSIGKREALRRLQASGVAAKPTAFPVSRRARKSPQNNEEYILSLLRQGEATTTDAINAAWSKARRRSNAYNTLSRMVKKGKLRMTKVKNVRGSRYSLA
jgi:DNA-binding transcriptional regulator YiaG